MGKRWMLLGVLFVVVLAVNASAINVCTAEELDAVRNNLTADYVQVCDIDLEVFGEWTPIGGDNNEFTGTYDGKGHKISGLVHNSANSVSVGLFGGLGSTAIVSNVRLESASIIVSGTFSKWTGGIAGYSDGTIRDSSVSGVVVGYHDVGGLVGYLGRNGIIERSFSTANVEGGDVTGGLVGLTHIAGNPQVIDSYSNGSVTSSVNRAGGLIGDISNATVTNSYSSGFVSSPHWAGGLIGGVGGGLITSSYWDKESGGQTTSAGGVGKTTAQMKQQSTFQNWDFANVWNIVNEETYPWLKWEGAQDFACSSQDQKILGISAVTNAHGEIANQNNYLIDICYDDIFGVKYSGATRDCTIEGKVLRLSGDTNAHGEIIEESTGSYSDVCYGDLDCNSISLTEQCDIANGQREVISLSGNTNAHMETADADGFQSGYKVCCYSGQSGGGPGEITYVEWQDAFGSKITETNKGRTVTVYAETTAEDGTIIEFDVWDDDGIFGRDIIFGKDGFGGSLVGSIENGLASSSFKITNEIVDSAGGEIDCKDGLEFYFEARIPDSSMESGLLTVSCEEGDNEPPRANITSPTHRGIYFTNVPILFNQSSFDPENNIINFLWVVEKNGELFFEDTRESFYYSFDQNDADQYTITLRVEDEYGLYDEDQVSIIVTASPGMMAYINEPFHQAVLRDLDLKFRFNASDSYVINTVQGNFSNNCDYYIECTGGNCPPKTENSPNGCNKDKLDVSPPLDVGFNDGNLLFSWRFYDEVLDNPIMEIDRVTGITAFGVSSHNFNDKNIGLNLKFDNGTGDLVIDKNTNREFTLVDGRQCIEGGRTWLELDENGFVIGEYDTLNNPDACKGVDGTAGTGDDCCPALMKCVDGEGCVSDEGSDITSCGDYETSGQCFTDEYGIGRLPEPVDPMWDTLNCGGLDENGRIVQCECDWDTDDDECGLKASYRDSGGGNNACEENTCLVTYEEGQCDNGFMEIYVNAKWEGGECDKGVGEDECNEFGGTHIVPCGRPIIELPFFGGVQFAIALIVIFIIYYVFFRTKKRK
ncbi:hypothetical protein AUJ63_00650 [Candidatus Pacearchaeota archaeon CG1_02_35_32]|nr:MAG: hypothetical protein AUJ63_00650 [Candidatus Pacearchaeota archaeon CG1_02_35_32]